MRSFASAGRARRAHSRARAAIAPLLRSVQPDLVVCMGFPWKIPREALEVPTLGWLNGHPSLLPRHRGPCRRVGDPGGRREDRHHLASDGRRPRHRLDPGPGDEPIGEYVEPEDFYPRLGRLSRGVGQGAREALRRRPGHPAGGGGLRSFFTDADAMLDLGRPAVEVHRLVWAWRYALSSGALQGAIVSSTARRCACSPPRSLRSTAHVASSVPTARSGSSAPSRSADTATRPWRPPPPSRGRA